MEEIPDLNLFMMCKSLSKEALSELPVGYSVGSCRPDELTIWKAMPFDDPDTAHAYEKYMEEYLLYNDLFRKGRIVLCSNLVCL